jgi:hypothetical protein
VRTQARLKLGYYPLAQAEAVRIRNHLQFSADPASVSTRVPARAQRSAS